MGGVVVGAEGGGRGGAPQRLQALLVPHVGSPGATAVRGGQVQGGTALQRTERTWTPLSVSLPVDRRLIIHKYLRLFQVFVDVFLRN